MDGVLTLEGDDDGAGASGPQVGAADAGGGLETRGSHLQLPLAFHIRDMFPVNRS